MIEKTIIFLLIVFTLFVVNGCFEDSNELEMITFHNLCEISKISKEHYVSKYNDNYMEIVNEMEKLNE